jgi:hypothetical protein
MQLVACRFVVWECGDRRLLPLFPGEEPHEDLNCLAHPAQTIEIRGPATAIRTNGIALEPMRRKKLEAWINRLRENSCTVLQELHR